MSLHTAALEIAAGLPVGDPTRRELLATLRDAASEVGPFLRFNNKLWVQTHGGKMRPKEGGWTRLKLVDPRTGAERKTEVEIHWGRPGELSVWMSGRKQPTFKYEDVGIYAPPVNPKEVKALIRDEPKAKVVAKQLLEAAKAQGLTRDAAIGFASDVLQDVNWSSLSGDVGGDNQLTDISVSDVSQSFDWDAYAAAALAWHVGDSSTKSTVEAALMSELQRQNYDEMEDKYGR